MRWTASRYCARAAPARATSTGQPRSSHGQRRRCRGAGRTRTSGRSCAPVEPPALAAAGAGCRRAWSAAATLRCPERMKLRRRGVYARWGCTPPRAAAGTTPPWCRPSAAVAQVAAAPQRCAAMDVRSSGRWACQMGVRPGAGAALSAAQPHPAGRQMPLSAAHGEIYGGLRLWPRTELQPGPTRCAQPPPHAARLAC